MSTPQEATPGRSYQRYVLAMMTTVYMLNLVDRGLMMLLLQPIKVDLQLSDTQLGFLTGIAFALFYAVMGLPIARWADRGNRVNITSIAIGLWGLTVMACVLVANYVQLLFARIAAAVGEAGCKPPTYSLVGDYFPQPAERTRAMAFYISGNFLSTLLAYAVGGWLNERYGWRMTFFLMGILGLILAVAVKLTIVEPRTQFNAVCAGERETPPMRAVMLILWRQRSFRHLCAALILLYSVALGLGPWQAAFMMRSYHIGTAELGLWLGLICSMSGIAGALLGGYAAGRYFAGNERGQMRASAVAVASILPCLVAFLTLPQKHQALMALIPLMVVFSVFLGPTYALMQRLVADDMRATMMAIVMLLANLIGMGIGPQLVGILSDLLTPQFGDDALRYAMLSMSFVSLWSAYHFWRVGATVAEDLPRTAKASTLNGIEQGDYHPAVERQLIHSQYVAQTFEVRIMLPLQRAGETARFPVVYATDANLAFDMLKGIATVLQLSERDMPRFILVGIGYPSDAPRAGAVLRGRDMTFPGYPKLDRKPPPVQGVLLPESGTKDFNGAEDFQQFIEHELMPFIDARYPTVAGERSYFGHSLGGGFGLFTLFTRANLFNRYILSSPGLTFHGESSGGVRYENYEFALEYAGEFIAAKKSLKATTVYLSVGSEEEFEPGVAHWQLTSSFYRLVALLKAADIQGLELRSEVFPGATHTTAWPLAFMHGVPAVLRTRTTE